MGLGPKMRVEVVGLQDRPELNRATGTVLGFDVGMQRWKVRLDHGGVKMFREANLMQLGDLGQGETEDEPDSLPPELCHEPQAPALPEQQHQVPAAREERGLDRRVGVMEKQLAMILDSLKEQQTLLDELLAKETFDDHIRPDQQELDRRISSLEVDSAAAAEAQKQFAEDQRGGMRVLVKRFEEELQSKLDGQARRIEESELQWKTSRDLERNIAEQIKRLQESEEQNEALQSKIDEQLDRLEESEDRLASAAEQQGDLQKKLDEQMRSFQDSEQNWRTSKEQQDEIQKRLDEQFQCLRGWETLKDQLHDFQKQADDRLVFFQESEQEWRASKAQCQSVETDVKEQIRRLEDSERNFKDAEGQCQALQIILDKQIHRLEDAEQQCTAAVAQGQELQRKLDEHIDRLMDAEDHYENSWGNAPTQVQTLASTPAPEEGSIQQRKLTAITKAFEKKLDEQVQRLKDSEQQWMASRGQHEELERRLDHHIQRLESSEQLLQASQEQREGQSRLDEPVRRTEGKVPAQAADDMQQKKMFATFKAHAAASNARLTKMEEQHEELGRRLDQHLQRLESSEKLLQAAQEQREGQSRLDEPVRRMEEKVPARAADDMQQKKMFATVKAHTTASNARLTKMEEQLEKSGSTLRDVQTLVGVLQECLERKSILPACSILAGLHRRSFARVLATSGWRPDATAEDVFMEEQASARVISFGGSLLVPALQMALGASVAGSTFRAAGVLGRLMSAQAAAEARPDKMASWDRLKRSIQEAQAAQLDDEHVHAAKQRHVLGHARCAVARGSAREEVVAALRAAKEAGLGEAEYRSMETQAGERLVKLERIAESKRRLRVAMSWASASNLDKLRKAIADAEVVGVETEEITRAEKELAAVVLKEQAPEVGRPPEDLYSLLRRARPDWQQTDREAAVVKLMVCGITTIQRLATASKENNLNEHLRRSHQKVFTEETLTALSKELADRDARPSANS